MGSFAAAGQEIGLASAAVSLQIRALEEDLGVNLLDRNARSVILNAQERQRIWVVRSAPHLVYPQLAVQG